MTTAHSVTSSVEVDTDPKTAFSVFTEELDCWWIQGPINFFDASRAYFMRVEPGVGGRIVEVYDGTTGEGKEVARITEWEPGERLAWQSGVDDVSIEVTFASAGAGTRVEVKATIPAGGTDAGGTAWIRMTPVWFAPWIAKRDRVDHTPLRMSRLAVAVHYANPNAAARWLRDVFGFEPAADIPDGDSHDDHTWIEFHVGNASLMVFGRADESVPEHPTHTPWVFVDDLDEHYAHAKDKGARIVDEIWEHGARAYGAADLAGNHWTFAQAPPLMR